MNYKLALGFLLSAAACGDNGHPAVDGGVAIIDGSRPAAPDAPPATPGVKVTKTKLVGDEAGGTSTDPLLVNAWGLAIAPSGAFWVSANHTGKGTIYSPIGAPAPLVVNVPAPAGDADAAAPTGVVFNGTDADFKGDHFIWSTEDGTIAGWQDGTAAVIRVNRAAAGANFKGLAALDTAGGRVILGANFSLGTVNAWDNQYQPVVLDGGGFADPTLPAGYAPFNIMVDGTKVYIAYAKQDADKKDDVAGPSVGAIDVFDNTGAFVRRLVTGGALSAPWGMAIAPADYPEVARGDLIVGNFGDGAINIYDPATGDLRGHILDAQGAPLQIDGLWGLVFGTDIVPGESHRSLFYTAGPAGETHGALGRLDLAL